MQRLKKVNRDSIKCWVRITFDVELTPIILEELGAHSRYLRDRGHRLNSQRRAQNEGGQGSGIHNVGNSTQYPSQLVLLISCRWSFVVTQEC